MNISKQKIIIFFLISLFLFSGIFGIQSCGKNDAPGDPNTSLQLTDEQLQGGQNGSIKLTTALAFAQQLQGISTEESINFKVGRSFFHTSWVTAPSSTVSVDGLGPLFNATSCNSCHVEDGRGRTPFSPLESLSSVIIRLSIQGEDAHGGPNPHPDFGLQFRNRS